MPYRSLRLALAGLLTTSFNAAAATENGPVLEEIVVTSQKRNELLSDVPISMLAVQGEALRQYGIENLSNLSDIAPGFRFVEHGLIPNVYMRGVGSGSNQGFESSVGIFSDGIHLARSTQGLAAFMDQARVEVLRGPQTTYFGQNTIAGAINVISARPTADAGGRIQAAINTTHEDGEVEAVLSGPISESLAARTALRYRTEGGYMENLTQGREEPGVGEQAIRLILDWQPSDRLQAVWKLEGSERIQDGRTLQILSHGAMSRCTGEETELDYRRATSGPENLDFNGHSSTVDISFDLGGGYTLSYLNGYIKTDYKDYGDADVGEADNIWLRSDENYEMTSHEFRIASPQTNRLSFVAGAFYSSSTTEFDEIAEIDLRAGAITDDPTCTANLQQIAELETDRTYLLDAQTVSLFGEATLSLKPWLRATLGLRWIEEKKDGYRDVRVERPGSDVPVNPAIGLVLALLGVEEHTLQGNRKSNLVLPSAGLEIDVGQATMVYMNYREGAKTGGFDARNNNGRTDEFGGSQNFEFDDELAETWEAGIKSELSPRARLGIAVFSSDYQDMQVSTFDGSLGFVVTNAAEAQIRGAEVELMYSPHPILFLSASAAYLDFEWSDYKNGRCHDGAEPNSPVDETCDLTGRENAFSPDLTATLSLNIDAPLGGIRLIGGLAGTYIGDHFTYGDLDPRSYQDAFYKADARLGVAAAEDTWKIEALVKNLTNQEVLEYSFPTAMDSGGYSGTISRDRAFWLQGTLSF